MQTEVEVPELVRKKDGGFYQEGSRQGGEKQMCLKIYWEVEVTVG